MSSFDVLVIGAGHAGSEAALAAARLGGQTLLLTMNLDAIGQMSCNPAVGGTAKGHLVREIDALGGEMGRVTDRAAIQVKTLNASRGPAVRATRAQCDRARYRAAMKQTVEAEPGLEVRQGQAARFVLEGGRANSPRLRRGTIDFARLSQTWGDPEPRPFHWATGRLPLPQVACHTTYTTPATHAVIRENLDRSPLYSEVIDATGVRYCPSIEDKVVRFAERERHQVILEPIPGLERAEIMRPGYVERFKRQEQRLIPAGLDYRTIPGLSTEVRERLLGVAPRSLGQASRIPGITPAAISILAVWCHRAEAAEAVSTQ